MSLVNASPSAPATAEVHGVRAVVVYAYVLAFFEQDFGLTGRLFGRPGANLALMFLPLVVVAFWGDVHRALRNRLLRRIRWVFLAFFSVAGTSTLISLVSLPVRYRGEDLLIKGAKDGLSVAAWALSFCAGAVCVMVAPRVVRRALWGGLLVMGALLLLEVTGRAPHVVTNAGVFHIGPNIQQRPRLLTSESAAGGELMGSCVLLLALLERSSRTRVALAVVGTGFLIYLGSKGALAAWGLCLVLAFAMSFTHGRWSRTMLSPVTLALGVLVATFLVVSIANSISSSLDLDRDKYTSSATRDVYLRSGVVALRDRPEGAGFGAHIAYAEGWLATSRIELARKYRQSAFREIDEGLSGASDVAFAPKSLPVNLIYQAGVAGFALFLGISVSMLRTMSSRDDDAYWIAASGLFCIIAIGTYVTSLYEYNMTMLMGFLILRGRPKQLRSR